MRLRGLILAWCLVAALTAPACDDKGGDPDKPRQLTESELWDQAMRERDVELFERYVSQYPSGPNAQEAKKALKDLWKDKVDKLTPSDMEKLTVVIETNRGVIKFKFFAQDAPKTCRNFIRLAKSHFYDGLIFHRVIDGYLIQTGCPVGDGTGNPGYALPAEFNDRQHLEGTVAMARGSDHDSAGSQFYICLSPQPKLDRRFTVFGQVSETEGIDVVKAIGAAPANLDTDKPDADQIMKKVYIEGL